ncbi:hypothetical protein AB1Y20_000773 [Prymnesium parvum]|uniref:DH domain-containing protein n=1 Tax=Prymnesium parvum TaxID=97485 RepID=A0AB34K937_PRYPA
MASASPHSDSPVSLSSTPRSFTSKRRSQVHRMKLELQNCLDASIPPTPLPLNDSSNTTLRAPSAQPPSPSAPSLKPGAQPAARGPTDENAPSPSASLESPRSLDQAEGDFRPAVDPPIGFEDRVIHAAHEAAALVSEAAQLRPDELDARDALLGRLAQLLAALEASAARRRDERTPPASLSSRPPPTEASAPATPTRTPLAIERMAARVPTPADAAVRCYGRKTPATPSYAATGRAALCLQAAWRGRAARSRVGARVAELRLRGRTAHELVASEKEYLRQLRLLISRYFLPLQQRGLPADKLRTLFGNVQVLLNLSRTAIAQLGSSAPVAAPPSTACADTLLKLLPSLKIYQQYVSGYPMAQQLLSQLMEQDDGFRQCVAEEEAKGDNNTRLDVLLVAPVRRLPNYGMYMERMIKLTPQDAPERACFCQESPAASSLPPSLYNLSILSIAAPPSLTSLLLLGTPQAAAAVQELCLMVDASLAENESRGRVVQLHSEFAGLLGPVMPHRRFLFEGELCELNVEPGRGSFAVRHVVLFNDILLLLNAPSGVREAIDCISLAKVQVKLLPHLVGGPAPYAFELWSIAKIWRFGAASEEFRSKWVAQIQQQVRFLLASFKQRGKSLAFIPQSVSLLRERLSALREQRTVIEEQVVDLTTGMSLLDEQSKGDRQRLAELERKANRRSLGDDSAKDKEIEVLRQRVSSSDANRAQLQDVTNKCIEELFELCNILDATDEQHNDDSLLQYMLFSST